MSKLTQARVRELLDFDPAAGIMRWRQITANRVTVGRVAGWNSDQGYVMIGIDGRKYRRSHLAWLWVHGRPPTPFIDHRNGRRDDDRLCNLREATKSQNNTNRRPCGRLGLKGVREYKSNFQAYIKFEGRQLYLGTWPTAPAAAVVHNDVAEFIHGEFAYTARV